MLQDLFLGLMRRHAVSDNRAKSLWEEIENTHSAEGRHYHNLNHLAQIADELLPLKENFGDWDAVLVALFYHDFIYEPTAGGNEEQSAAVAEERLKTVLPEAVLRKAASIILATKAHEDSGDNDTNLFTDADLSILGQDAAAYRRYAGAVRKEYAMFPDALYVPGRAAVMGKLLALPALYKTAHFAERYEAAARRNLKLEQEAAI